MGRQFRTKHRNNQHMNSRERRSQISQLPSQERRFLQYYDIFKIYGIRRG